MPRFWGGPDFLLSLETLNVRCCQDMLEEWDDRCRMGLEL